MIRLKSIIHNLSLHDKDLKWRGKKLKQTLGLKVAEKKKLIIFKVHHFLFRKLFESYKREKILHAYLHLLINKSNRFFKTSSYLAL